MFAKDFATLLRIKAASDGERRGKFRFPIRRELRYKLLRDGALPESGAGETMEMGSDGVGFTMDRPHLPIGAFIELSISWPVLLEESCPMRLNIFGRVVRSEPGKAVCTVDKYEFRTQSRIRHLQPIRHDSNLQRWAETVRKDGITQLKPRMMA